MQENQQITKKEQYNLNKLQKRLRRNVGEAIADFNMIEEGDRIMVCLSGVKTAIPCWRFCAICSKARQSIFRWWLLTSIKSNRASRNTFCPSILKKLGVEYKIVEENTYGIVKEKIPEGKTTCSLCSPSSRYPLSYRNGTGGDEDRVGSPS